jgi:hypothetical protein
MLTEAERAWFRRRNGFLGRFGAFVWPGVDRPGVTLWDCLVGEYDTGAGVMHNRVVEETRHYAKEAAPGGDWRDDFLEWCGWCGHCRRGKDPDDKATMSEYAEAKVEDLMTDFFAKKSPTKSKCLVSALFHHLQDKVDDDIAIAHEFSLVNLTDAEEDELKPLMGEGEYEERERFLLAGRVWPDKFALSRDNRLCRIFGACPHCKAPVWSEDARITVNGAYRVGFLCGNCGRHQPLRNALRMLAGFRWFGLPYKDLDTVDVLDREPLDVAERELLGPEDDERFPWLKVLCEDWQPVVGQLEPLPLPDVGDKLRSCKGIVRNSGSVGDGWVNFLLRHPREPGKFISFAWHADGLVTLGFVLSGGGSANLSGAAADLLTPADLPGRFESDRVWDLLIGRGLFQPRRHWLGRVK